ncbi:Pol polyprotein [Plecturocebus cupreus]
MPQTKQELRKFLELVGYCCLWINSYALHKKPFHLFINVDGGVALGVLTQGHRGHQQSVAFLVKVLDPVTCGWPQCIQSIAATAILFKESRKLTFGGVLTVSMPHQVRTILNQKAGRWLTHSTILNKGQDLLHKELITQVLNNLQLPEEIAIVHVLRHQKSLSFKSQGNNLADQIVKQATVSSEMYIFHLIPYLSSPTIISIFSSTEKEKLIRIWC